MNSNWDLKPIYDVVAKIPGSSNADQWVIRGNHHDGWVNGADDPISGASAELEEMRGLSEMLKQGWKPKRTIRIETRTATTEKIARLRAQVARPEKGSD